MKKIVMLGLGLITFTMGDFSLARAAEGKWWRVVVEYDGKQAKAVSKTRIPGPQSHVYEMDLKPGQLLVEAMDESGNVIDAQVKDDPRVEHHDTFLPNGEIRGGMRLREKALIFLEIPEKASMGTLKIQELTPSGKAPALGRPSAEGPRAARFSRHVSPSQAVKQIPDTLRREVRATINLKNVPQEP